MSAPVVALAFSGGLDTSWCVPHLRSQGFDVVTVTVDVGGFSDQELKQIARRSHELGAIEHRVVDARAKFFDQVLRYLIAGNVLRGGTYPICVGAERTLQAMETAGIARQIGAKAIAHGCTAAGNDQFRFELALKCLAPEIPTLAPIRDLAPSRSEQVAWLSEQGFSASSAQSDYSINAGMWGITIGGKETAGTTQSIPEETWPWSSAAFTQLETPRKMVIGWTEGIPTSLDDETLSPVELIEQLNRVGAKFGIGRGIHLGETILGIKGRVAFEAPAAYLLIQSHRELEKLVLTQRQQRVKDMVAVSYGDFVHEGLLVEPAARDIESLLRSSQERVTGTVTVHLRAGSFMIEGASSPHSLHAASRAVYGEATGEWTPEDAKGFAKLHGLPAVLASRSGGSH